MMMLEFLIVPLALWAALRLLEGRRPSRGVETPPEILQRRYASGEISREEFEQVKRALL